MLSTRGRPTRKIGDEPTEAEYEEALDAAIHSINLHSPSSTDTEALFVNPHAPSLNSALYDGIRDVVKSFRARAGPIPQFERILCQALQQLVERGHYNFCLDMTWDQLKLLGKPFELVEDIPSMLVTIKDGTRIDVVSKSALIFAQALFASAVTDDPRARRRATIDSCLLALSIVRGIAMLAHSHVARRDGEALYYLVVDSSIVAFGFAEFLVLQDAYAAWKCYPSLATFIYIFESHASLAAVDFVAWRCRLYGLIGKIFDKCGLSAKLVTEKAEDVEKDASIAVLRGFISTARQVFERGLRNVAALKRLYLADPPTLEATLQALDQAKVEMAIRKFRYDTLADAKDALLTMEKIVPSVPMQVLAITLALTNSDGSFRRTVLHSPPGAEVSKCYQQALSILDENSASKTATAVVSELEAAEKSRVGLLVQRITTLLMPAMEELVPSIAEYVNHIAEVVKSGAHNSSFVRPRSSLSAGFMLRSALKKPAEPSAAETVAPVDPFPASITAFESSASAAMLPLTLHAHLVFMMFEYEQWLEFDFFLHALEARLECVNATDAHAYTPFAGLHAKCQVLRRIREMEVGSITVPALSQIKTGQEVAETARSANKGADTKAAARPESRKTAGKPTKETTKAAPDTVPAPQSATPELSVSPAALLQGDGGPAQLPVVGCSAVHLLALSDAIRVCLQRAPRAISTTATPQFRLLSSTGSAPRPLDQARNDADIIRDAVLVLYRQCSKLQAWRDRHPIARKPQHVTARIDDVLQECTRVLFQAACTFRVDDASVFAAIALQRVRVCLAGDDAVAAVQAGRAALTHMNRLRNEAALGSIDEEGDAEKLEQRTLEASHTDLLFAVYSAEARLSTQRSFQRTCHNLLQSKQQTKQYDTHVTVIKEPSSSAHEPSRPAFASTPYARWLSVLHGTATDVEEDVELVAKVMATASDGAHEFKPDPLDEARWFHECSKDVLRKAALRICLVSFSSQRKHTQDELRKALTELTDTGSYRKAMSVRQSEAVGSVPLLLTMSKQPTLPQSLRNVLEASARKLQAPSSSTIAKGKALTATSSAVPAARAARLPPPEVVKVLPHAVRVRVPETTPQNATVVFFGKPVGAGTEVTASNKDLAGTGYPIRVCSNVAGAFARGEVEIRDLLPNEKYHFAYSLDETATTVSLSSQPVLTAHSLSDGLIVSYLALQAAHNQLWDVVVTCAARLMKRFTTTVAPAADELPAAYAFTLKHDVVQVTPRVEIQLFARLLTVLAQVLPANTCPVIEGAADAWIPSELNTIHRIRIATLATELGMWLRDDAIIHDSSGVAMNFTDQIAQLTTPYLPDDLVQPCLTLRKALGETRSRSEQHPMTHVRQRVDFTLGLLLLGKGAGKHPAALEAIKRYFANNTSVNSTPADDSSALPAVLAVLEEHKIIPSHVNGKATESEAAYLSELLQQRRRVHPLGTLAAFAARINTLGLSDSPLLAMPGLHGAETPKFVQIASELLQGAGDLFSLLDNLCKRHLYAAESAADASAKAAKGKDAPPAKPAGKPAAAAAAQQQQAAVALTPCVAYNNEFLDILHIALQQILGRDSGTTTVLSLDSIEQHLRRLSETQAATADTPPMEKERREDLLSIHTMYGKDALALLENIKKTPARSCSLMLSLPIILTLLRPIIIAVATEPPKPVSETADKTDAVKHYTFLRDCIFKALLTAQSTSEYATSNSQDAAHTATKYGGIPTGTAALTSSFNGDVWIRQRLLQLATVDYIRAHAILSTLHGAAQQSDNTSSSASAACETSSVFHAMISPLDRSDELIVPQYSAHITPPSSPSPDNTTSDAATSQLFRIRTALSAASDAASLAFSAHAMGLVQHAARVAWAAVSVARLQPAMFGVPQDAKQDEEDEAPRLMHSEWNETPPVIERGCASVSAELDWVPLWRLGNLVLQWLLQVGHLEESWWGTGSEALWKLRGQSSLDPAACFSHAAIVFPDPVQPAIAGTGGSDAGSQMNEEEAPNQPTGEWKAPPGFTVDDLVWAVSLLSFISEAIVHAQEWRVATAFGFQLSKLQTHIRTICGGVEAFSQAPAPETPDYGWSGVGAATHLVKEASFPANEKYSVAGVREHAHETAAKTALRERASFALSVIDDTLIAGISTCCYAAKIDWSLAKVNTTAAQEQLSAACTLFENRPSMQVKPKHRKSTLQEQMALLASEEREFEQVRSALTARIQQFTMQESVRWRDYQIIRQHVADTFRDLSLGRKCLNELRNKTAVYLAKCAVEQGIFTVPFGTAAVLPRPVLSGDGSGGTGAVAGGGIAGPRRLRAQRDLNALTLPSINFNSITDYAAKNLTQLRARRELALLAQAYMCLSQVHMAEAAKSSVHHIEGQSLVRDAVTFYLEALDAVFGSTNVIDNWRNLLGPNLHDTFHSLGVLGCLVCALACEGAVAAAEFCDRYYNNDTSVTLTVSQRAELHALAAVCLAAPFKTSSLLHPAHFHQFSRHRPSVWIPGINIFADQRVVAAEDLLSAMHACAKGLLSNGGEQVVYALPVCCAFEYAATALTGDVKWLADARVLRARVQMEIGDFGGALETICLLYAGTGFTFVDNAAVSETADTSADARPKSSMGAKGGKAPAAAPTTATAESTGKEDTGVTDTRFRERDISFYPKFYNHLPLAHPWNAAALKFTTANDDNRAQLHPYLEKVLTGAQKFLISMLRTQWCLSVAFSTRRQPYGVKTVSSGNSFYDTVLQNVFKLGVLKSDAIPRPVSTPNSEAARNIGQTDDTATETTPTASTGKAAKDSKAPAASEAATSLDASPSYPLQSAKQQLYKLGKRYGLLRDSVKTFFSDILVVPASSESTGDKQEVSDVLLPIHVWFQAVAECAISTANDRAACDFYAELLSADATMMPVQLESLSSYAMRLNTGGAASWFDYRKWRIAAAMAALRIGAPHVCAKQATALLQDCRKLGDADGLVAAHRVLCMAYSIDGEPQSALESALECFRSVQSLVNFTAPDTLKRVPGGIQLAMLLVGAVEVSENVRHPTSALQAAVAGMASQCNISAEGNDTALLIAHHISLWSLELTGCDVGFWQQKTSDWLQSSSYPLLPAHPARLSVDNLYHPFVDTFICCQQRTVPRLMAAGLIEIALERAAFTQHLIASHSAMPDAAALGLMAYVTAQTLRKVDDLQQRDRVFASYLLAAVASVSVDVDTAARSAHDFLQFMVYIQQQGLDTVFAAVVPYIVEVLSFANVKKRIQATAAQSAVAASKSQQSASEGKDKAGKGKEKEAPTDASSRLLEYLPAGLVQEIRAVGAAAALSAREVLSMFSPNQSTAQTTVQSTAQSTLTAASSKAGAAIDPAASVAFMLDQTQNVFATADKFALPNDFPFPLSVKTNALLRCLQQLFGVSLLPNPPVPKEITTQTAVSAAAPQRIAVPISTEYADKLRFAIGLYAMEEFCIVACGPQAAVTSAAENAAEGKAAASKQKDKSSKQESKEADINTPTAALPTLDICVVPAANIHRLRECCIAARTAVMKYDATFIAAKAQLGTTATTTTTTTTTTATTSSVKSGKTDAATPGTILPDKPTSDATDAVDTLLTSFATCLCNDATKVAEFSKAVVAEAPTSSAVSADKKAAPTKAPTSTTNASTTGISSYSASSLAAASSDSRNDFELEDFDVDVDGAVSKPPRVYYVVLALNRLLLDGEAIRMRSLSAHIRKLLL